MVVVAGTADATVTVGSASAAAALSARNRSNSLLVSDSSGTVAETPEVGCKKQIHHIIPLQILCITCQLAACESSGLAQTVKYKELYHILQMKNCAYVKLSATFDLYLLIKMCLKQAVTAHHAVSKRHYHTTSKYNTPFTNDYITVQTYYLPSHPAKQPFRQSHSPYAS